MDKALLDLFIFQDSPDWFGLFKQIGAAGVVCVFMGIVIWKIFIPMMKSTIDDSRKERDYMRARRDEEVDKFVESLKSQGEVFRSSLETIVRERTSRR